MPTFDIDKMAEQIISAMRSYVARGIEKVTQRLEAFEAQLANKVDREGITAFVSGYVEERIKLIEVPAGKDGRAGIDGKDGAPGKDGRDGIDGKEGAPGTQGTEGSPGRAGQDGAIGPKGEQGESGIAGKDGAPGPQGERGEKGSDGRDGRDAKDGRDGKDGEPGRDALDISVLSEVFLSKSYPRGTFAEHNGGMIYAARNTDPIEDSRSLVDAGWRCALRGIAKEEIELLDDGRIQKRTITYTDNTVHVVQNKTSNVVFRGVQKPGQTYDRGDQVLRQGSTWICLRETAEEARPGAEDWVLSTKKGADGRDGKNGEPGPRGPEGKPGRDLTQMAFDGTKY